MKKINPYAIALLALLTMGIWGQQFMGGDVPEPTTFTSGTTYFVSDGDTVWINTGLGLKTFSIRMNETEVFSIDSTGRVYIPNGSNALPALAFESDSSLGIYKIGTDRLGIGFGDGNLWEFNAVRLFGGGSTGPEIFNNAATGTVPTLIPNRSDENTGYSRDGNDSLCLVVGGKTVFKVTKGTDARMRFIPGTSGGLVTTAAEVLSGSLSGTSVTLETNIPLGANIIGCQANVETAITTDDGLNYTWDLAYDADAGSQAIVTAGGEALNTKANVFFDPNINSPISTGEVDLVLTPNAGGLTVFTAGKLRVVTYYQIFDPLANAE